MARQEGEAALQWHQRIVLGLLVQGLGARGADDRLHAEQELAGLRRPARLDHAALDVVVQRLGAGKVGLDGEHRVGIARREVAALARRAGLQDGRPMLRRARHVERPARLEVSPLMLDAMHLRRVGEYAPGAVHDHGILVPAVPQLAADLHEFIGAVVAIVGRPHLLAEIGRLVVVERGHDVPGGATAGQVIERRPQPSGMEGMLVAHRIGGAQTDLLGDRGHERQQRDRIVLGRLGGVANRRRQRAGIGVGDVVEVGEEDHVELAALADLGDVLVEGRPRPVVACLGGARMPPHRYAVIGRPVDQELGQMHHRFGHAASPDSVAMRRDRRSPVPS